MWKQEVIKQFELDEKTTILLVKNIYYDGSIAYDILKQSNSDSPQSIYPFDLNETDAENIYNLYKNKILDFKKEEYIKKLWNENNNLNYEIEELKEKSISLFFKGDK